MSHPYPPADTTQQLPPYGQPSYPPPAPQRNSLVPWLIGTLVLLVAVAGVLAFLLLRADDTADSNPAQESAQAEEQLGDLDGDAVVPPEADEEQVPDDHGTPYAGDGGQIIGSVDRGAAFLDDVVLGDFPTAIGHGGSDFQAYYAGDADLLSAEIAEAAGGTLPVNYTIDAVSFDPGTASDVLDVTLELPDGSYDGMVVLVGQEGGTAVVIGFQ
ncbi:hypothetical protein ACI78T_11145 [Blastococcus sp. SYSU D00922]